MKVYQSPFLAAIFALQSLFAANAYAQSLKDQPGYVDLGQMVETIGIEPKVEISLGPALLGFMSAAAKDEDTEMAGLLGGLVAIRVNVFELPESATETTRTQVASLARKLEERDWERAVLVREDDSLVYMYMKMNQNRIAGLTVLVVEDEAVFINIVGEMEPSQLGRLAKKLGVPLSLDGMM